MIAKAIKKTVKIASKGNKAALKNSEKLVKQFLHFGEEYNKRVLKKALKGGVKIAKRQHALNMEALSLTKEHLYNAKKRWNQLTNGSLDEIIEDVQEFAQESKETVEKTINELNQKAEEFGIKPQSSKDTTDQAADDLTKINGVGPKFAEILQENGIRTFKDLAKGSLDELKKKLEEKGGRYKAIDLDELSKKASELIKS